MPSSNQCFVDNRCRLTVKCLLPNNAERKIAKNTKKDNNAGNKCMSNDNLAIYTWFRYKVDVQGGVRGN